MLQNLFSPRRAAQRQGFASKLVVGNGDAAYDTSAEVAAIVEANTANAAFTKIWQATVPPQQQWRWGSGQAVLQRNQGYMHFMAMDVAIGFEDGLLRLVIANRNETRRMVVMELNTQTLHTTTFTTVITGTPTSIDAMIPVPEQPHPYVAEDSRMILEFRTTVATTTVDAVDFSIPYTIYQ